MFILIDAVEPLESLIARAQHATKDSHGRVIGVNGGFVFVHPDLFRGPNGGHIYFPGIFRGLQVADMETFPGLYGLARHVVQHNGIDMHLRQPIIDLLDASQKGYAQAAISIPGISLGSLDSINVKPGEWGIFDYYSIDAAAQSKAMKFDPYIESMIPIFTVINGQNVILTPIRADRPKPRENVPQMVVFPSLYHGFPFNPWSKRNILISQITAGTLLADVGTIDNFVDNHEWLASNGIGSLVRGEQIVVSLGSRDQNRVYQSALDNPFTDQPSVKDLASLRLAGVNAITIVNRFHSFARVIDEKTYFSLAKSGFDMTGTNFEGKPLVAQGVCLVTYSTGFETNYAAMNKEKVADMFESMQQAISKVILHTGYEKAHFIIGENVGKAAGGTLEEIHLQSYVSKNVKIRPPRRRIEPTLKNVLYENQNVYVIADPKSYGQVIFQFKKDKDFLLRDRGELLDLADARLYHFKRMRDIGFKGEHNLIMAGNDFVVRYVPKDERDLGFGFVERSGWMVSPSADIKPSDLNADVPGHRRLLAYRYRQD